METNDKTPERRARVVPGTQRQSLVRATAVPEREPKRDKDRKKNKKKEKPSSAGRGVETMFRTSYRTHIDMSGLADSKANIMISINGIIVSILLGAISSKIETNPWLLLPTATLLTTCLVSLVFAVLAARPRVSHHVVTLEDVRRNAANILFFGNFISMSEDDYILGMKELLQDNERLYTNMIRDIYSLGSVLDRKFRLLRTSYTVFMFGLIAGVTLFILVYVSVVLLGPPAVPGRPI
jgi:hypothetical protein